MLLYIYPLLLLAPAHSDCVLSLRNLVILVKTIGQMLKSPDMTELKLQTVLTF